MVIFHVRTLFTLYLAVREILRVIKGEIFSFSLSSPFHSLSLPISFTSFFSYLAPSLSLFSLSFSLAYLINVFALVYLKQGYTISFVNQKFQIITLNTFFSTTQFLFSILYQLAAYRSIKRFFAIFFSSRLLIIRNCFLGCIKLICSKYFIIDLLLVPVFRYF